MRRCTDGSGEKRGGDLLDGVDSPQNRRENEPVGTPLATANRPGGSVEAAAVTSAAAALGADAAAVVPHELALILRDELDVSCRLGSAAAAAGLQKVGTEDVEARSGGAREEEVDGSRAGPGVDG